MNNFNLRENWDQKRLKYIFNYSLSSIDRKQKIDEKIVDICHYPNVYNDEKIFGKETLEEGTCTEEEFKSYQLKKDDIVITKDSEDPKDIGVPCLIKNNLENTVCGYHLGIIRTKKNLDREFFLRYLQTNYVKDYFYCESNGVTRFGLSKSSVENLLIPIPSIREQKLISSFLEKKLYQIDKLLEKIKKRIQLLKDQKQSLINETVTKGLNKNVRFKESGIDWIGEVPIHWDIKKLRYLGFFSNGISESAEFFESGFPFLTYSDIYKNFTIPIPSGVCMSSQSDWEKYSVKYGDIFFTRTSEDKDDIGISSVCLKTIEKCCFSGFLVRFRPNDNRLNPKFSKFYFRSSIPLTHFAKEMNIVTRASLAQPLLKTTPVIIPPEEEQEDIANFLEFKVNTIDQICDAEQKRIDKLYEYRRSLISSVITDNITLEDELL